MKILRAKTKELFHSTLTKEQQANSALNIAELESGALKLKSYPRRIVLEMTSACNIKCIFCGRDEAEFNQTYLKLDVLDKLQKPLEVCEEVTLFGWGEPTINPKFSEFLRRLNESNVRKYFVTNGMRLDKFIDDIFTHKVDIIAVSLDGADSAINDKIRVGSKFSKITQNIAQIQEKKRALGVEYPYMNFVFVAMESNIRELPKMVKLAKNLNMQEVKVVFLSAFSADMLSESLYNKQNLVREAFNAAIEVAKKLDIKLKLPFIQGEDIAGDKYHKDCFVGWRDFFIGSDDSIRPCQSTSLKLGKFSEFADFESAWNSEAFQNFRARVNANNCDLRLLNTSLKSPPPRLQMRQILRQILRNPQGCKNAS
ncbi:radical SAM protein [Helicobacter sp. 23-1044]